MKNKLLKERYIQLVRENLSSIEKRCPLCYKKHKCYFIEKDKNHANCMVLCPKNNKLAAVKTIHKELIKTNIIPSLEEYIKTEKAYIKSKQKELF